MDSSTGGEIHVFPEIYDAKRNSSGPAISSNNFNLEINLVAKHSYSCGDNSVEDCQFGTTWVYKYNSFSWDIVDRELLASDHFPYSLGKVKWDGVDKILESKDDLIQQILEFARTVQNVTSPFQDDDTVYVRLTFIKKVFVSPQEFEDTKEEILLKHYEYCANILWKIVLDEIKGWGQGSSLYEEFQSLADYVETIVRETAYWRMCIVEDYEMVLIESLLELARKEFRLLPAVRSRMQFLQAVHLPEKELTSDECLICMNGYLPGSEAYNMPCNHSFHFDCIETWLLKEPSCPMCRFKLPVPTE